MVEDREKQKNIKIGVEKNIIEQGNLNEERIDGPANFNTADDDYRGEGGADEDDNDDDDSGENDGDGYELDGNSNKGNDILRKQSQKKKS